MKRSTIYQPKIFAQFPEVRAALTMRGATGGVYANNMSLGVGDDPEHVADNRRRLTAQLGFREDRVASQRQVHGCAIELVTERYCPGESDALITDQRGWLLAVSIGDCVPVLFHDPVHQIVAGAHSGWRGTLRNITGSTIERLAEEFGVDPADLWLYIGASAGQCCYEVGEDVAGAFDPGFSRPLGEGKHLFDNRGVVLRQALDAGVPAAQIELDERCTICGTGFHSYRRDGGQSGRMFAVIGMLEETPAGGAVSGAGGDLAPECR